MKNDVSVKQSVWLKENGFNTPSEYVYVNGKPFKRRNSEINMVSQNIQSWSYIPDLGAAMDFMYAKFGLGSVPLIDIIGEPELPHHYLSSAMSYMLDKCMEYVDANKIKGNHFVS